MHPFFTVLGVVLASPLFFPWSLSLSVSIEVNAYFVRPLLVTFSSSVSNPGMPSVQAHPDEDRSKTALALEIVKIHRAIVSCGSRGQPPVLSTTIGQ